jgi:hypothetical protein
VVNLQRASFHTSLLARARVQSSKWRVANKACNERPCWVWWPNTQEKSQHTRKITTRSAAKSSQRLQEKTKKATRGRIRWHFNVCKRKPKRRQEGAFAGILTFAREKQKGDKRAHSLAFFARVKTSIEPEPKTARRLNGRSS